MYSSFKIIALVFILFAKTALGYFDVDLDQAKGIACVRSADHSNAVHPIDGPFVFENESRSETEDDNDDDLDCTIASHQDSNQPKSNHHFYNGLRKDLRNDSRLFILYGNFRL